MYTMEYYSAIRNDKYPPFASTWMELEGIKLSEVSRLEKDKYYIMPSCANVDNIGKYQEKFLKNTLPKITILKF